MAEYCLDCFNQINRTNYNEKDVWIDHEEFDICERCGKCKPCVIALHKKPMIERLKDKKRRRM